MVLKTAKHKLCFHGAYNRPINKADAKGQLTWNDRRLLSSVHGKRVMFVALRWHIRQVKRLKKLGVFGDNVIISPKVEK